MGGPRGEGGGEGEGDVEVRTGVGGRGAWGAMEREGQGGLVPGRVRGRGGRGRGGCLPTLGLGAPVQC